MEDLKYYNKKLEEYIKYKNKSKGSIMMNDNNRQNTTINWVIGIYRKPELNHYKEKVYLK